MSFLVITFVRCNMENWSEFFFAVQWIFSFSSKQLQKSLKDFDNTLRTEASVGTWPSGLFRDCRVFSSGNQIRGSVIQMYCWNNIFFWLERLQEG